MSSVVLRIDVSSPHQESDKVATHVVFEGEKVIDLKKTIFQPIYFKDRLEDYVKKLKEKHNPSIILVEDERGSVNKL